MRGSSARDKACESHEVMLSLNKDIVQQHTSNGGSGMKLGKVNTEDKSAREPKSGDEGTGRLSRIEGPKKLSCE